MNPFKRKLVTDNFANLIAHGTEIHGDVRFNGSIHIGGIVRGNIAPVDTTLAAAGKDEYVYILKDGMVDAELICASNVVIDGHCMGGRVRADNVLRIGKNARITDVALSYKTLEIAEGAYLDGCTMSIILSTIQETKNSD